MRNFSLLLLCAAALSPFLAAQSPEDALHVADARQREAFTSILIPPKTDAPFTATVSAEWTRQLPDSTTVTVTNHRLVMRDSRGRIYQERRRLVPQGQESRVMQIELSDPSRHVKYFCDPNTRVCALRDYFMPVATATQPVGPFDNGTRYLSRADLGKNDIGGIEAIGTRETVSVNAGAMGNNGTVEFTTEYWYSPRLDLNLILKRTDTLHGTQLISVSDLSLSEPDSSLFALPAGYKVVDERSPVAQSNQTQPPR